MNPKLRNLLIVIGVGVMGVLAGRELLSPAADGPAANAELVDAGILLCPLRNVRCLVRNPQGRMLTREGKVRVCGTDPVFSREARDALAAGWEIKGCINVSAATGGESELADVAHDCRCRAAAGACTAQRMNRNDTLQAAATLPFGTVAGPGYRWVNPSGAGCVPIPCAEDFAGAEWPTTCPLR